MTNTISDLQVDIIDAIVNIRNTNLLKELRAHVTNITRGRSSGIPITEIKDSMTLEELRSNQEVTKMSFAMVSEMFQDESWDKPLEELLLKD